MQRCRKASRPWTSQKEGAGFGQGGPLDLDDRGVRRPRASLRRATATLTHGPLTIDAGKQFIRWGKADIINPTDRFAPRDFINVVDTEFLAVTGVRAVALHGAETFEQTVTLYAQHKDQLELLEWLQVPFLALLVPAAFAVAWVSRRGAPRLTTAGALVALGGLCAGFGILPGVPHPAHLTVRDGLDVGAVSALSTAVEEHPIVQIGGLLFIVGITIGLLLLGLAMWRSGAAPAWMGWALALGGFTHPFMPGHVAAGIGLMVAAVGFAGASVALLRMRNEDFDLAPSR